MLIESNVDHVFSCVVDQLRALCIIAKLEHLLAKVVPERICEV